MFQNAARKANQSEIIAEKKRAEAPVESRGISKQKWFEEKQKRLGKQLELNGLNTSKAFMLDTQEQAETKYKKWEKKPAPFGWDGKARFSNLQDFIRFDYMISLLNQSNACRNRNTAEIPTERLCMVFCLTSYCEINMMDLLNSGHISCTHFEVSKFELLHS